MNLRRLIMLLAGRTSTSAAGFSSTVRMATEANPTWRPSWRVLGFAAARAVVG